MVHDVSVTASPKIIVMAQYIIESRGEVWLQAFAGRDVDCWRESRWEMGDIALLE